MSSHRYVIASGRAPNRNSSTSQAFLTTFQILKIGCLPWGTWMSGSMEKALAILEYLASRPDGASLVSIANDLNQIRSGCHRTLGELIKYGYVRPLPKRGGYALTTKLSSMGM